MNKKNIIRELIRDLGYNFNRTFVIKTGRHFLDNSKLGGWSKPDLWIDNKRIDKIEDEVLLDEVIEDLKSMILNKKEVKNA